MTDDVVGNRPTGSSREANDVAIFCSMGCCGGCERCYGYSLGCHQEPCRCSHPCDKNCAQQDECDPTCQRHNMNHDTRDAYDHLADYDEPDQFEDLDTECPECGESGPCGFDAEGRPMIHVTRRDDDDGA